MTTPDDTYKAAVLDLQSRLGRPPTTKDPEYVQLGEECRLAWIRHGRAEETVLPPRGNARNDAREGGMVNGDAYRQASEALGGPGAADKSPVALTEPEGDSGPDSASQTAMVGSRGPSGGIYAVCQACQRIWERPHARGRPLFKCPECRQ